MIVFRIIGTRAEYEKAVELYMDVLERARDEQRKFIKYNHLLRAHERLKSM
jgi:hypothetical protein